MSSVAISIDPEHGHSHKHGHHGHDASGRKAELLGNSAPRLVHEEPTPVMMQTLISLLKDPNARGTILFLAILFMFSFLELLYAKWADSLTLVASAFFDIIDASTILVAVWGQHVTQRANNRKSLSYSFGFDRFQMLAHFAINIFLLFVCLWAFFEGVERILEVEPVLIHGYMLMRLGVAGVAIRVIHVVVFRKHAMFARNPLTSDSKIAALLWEFLSDFMTIIVAFFVISRGYMIVDTFASMFLVTLIGYQAIPIVKQTGLTLLQTVPANMKSVLEQRLREASTLDGVLECSNEHFWDVGGPMVGTLRVRVNQNANEAVVLKQVKQVFRDIKYLTVQIVKDDWNVNSDVDLGE